MESAKLAYAQTVAGFHANFCLAKYLLHKLAKAGKKMLCRRKAQEERVLKRVRRSGLDSKPARGHEFKYIYIFYLHHLCI